MVVHTKLIKYRTETEVTMVPREWKSKYEMKKIVSEVWDMQYIWKVKHQPINSIKFYLSSWRHETEAYSLNSSLSNEKWVYSPKCISLNAIFTTERKLSQRRWLMETQQTYTVKTRVFEEFLPNARELIIFWSTRPIVL